MLTLYDRATIREGKCHFRIMTVKKICCPNHRLWSGIVANSSKQKWSPASIRAANFKNKNGSAGQACLCSMSTIAKGDHLRPCAPRRRRRSLLQWGPALHSKAALLNTLKMLCLISSNRLQEGQAAQRAVCDTAMIHRQQ